MDSARITVVGSLIVLMLVSMSAPAQANNYGPKSRSTVESRPLKKPDSFESKPSVFTVDDFPLKEAAGVYVIPVGFFIKIHAENAQAASNTRQQFISSLSFMARQLKRHLELSNLIANNEVVFVENMRSASSLPGIDPQLLDELKALEEQYKSHRLDLNHNPSYIRGLKLSLESESIQGILKDKKYLVFFDIQVTHQTPGYLNAIKRDESAQWSTLNSARNGPFGVLTHLVISPITDPIFDAAFPAPTSAPVTHTIFTVTLVDVRTGTYAYHHNFIAKNANPMDPGQMKVVLEEALKGLRAS